MTNGVVSEQDILNRFSEVRECIIIVPLSSSVLMASLRVVIPYAAPALVARIFSRNLAMLIIVFSRRKS